MRFLVPLAPAVLTCSAPRGVVGDSELTVGGAVEGCETVGRVRVDESVAIGRTEVV